MQIDLYDIRSVKTIIQQLTDQQAIRLEFQAGTRGPVIICLYTHDARKLLQEIGRPGCASCWHDRDDHWSDTCKYESGFEAVSYGCLGKCKCEEYVEVKQK